MTTTTATIKSEAELKALTLGELRAYYQEVVGRAPLTNKKFNLVRSILTRARAQAPAAEPVEQERTTAEYKAHAKAPSGARAARRARGAPRGRAKDAAPTTAKPERKRAAKARDPRLPAPGTVLERQIEVDGKRRSIRVEVLRDGFRWQGKEYRSLSKIATAATGTSWNGFLFFHLVGYARRVAARAEAQRQDGSALTGGGR